MVEVLNKPAKPFSWSFSAVDNFHTCARKYYHQVIKKDVSDDTTYRTEGGKIHDMMRDAVRGIHPLPPPYGRWRRWIDELHADGGKVMAEVRYAFTESLVPCDWYDKRAVPWCRSSLDILKFKRHQNGNARTAMVWDWKSGKLKPDDDQLMLYAFHVFLHFRSLDYVEASLIFLKEDTGPHVERNACTYELRIDRDDVKTWFTGDPEKQTEGYLLKVRRLERALTTYRGGPEDVEKAFPPTKSGLCRKHCPVTSCEFCGQ